MRGIAAICRILLWGTLAVCALSAQDWIAGLESADEDERVKAIRAMEKSPDGCRHLLATTATRPMGVSAASEA